MRRISVIVMALTSIFVIFFGIVESDSTGLAGHHIVAASLFFIAACFHCWYNRKPILKYISGLKWEWAVIAGCLIVMFALGQLIE
ncbi:MAG: hypothetical protein EHM12_04490 [Dehalococcoidia bacterium]|nr:MAG: hypothetical protein EHM12_04490 [Dehalococcoidia bacterium]